MRISCPAGVSGCDGYVTLLTRKAVRAGRATAVVELARTAYSLQAGETKTLRLRLAKGTAKLAKNKRLVVNARVSSRAGADQTKRFTLRFR
jgi:hypothetical protein